MAEKTFTKRDLSGAFLWLVRLVATGLALFHLYTAGFGFYPNIIQRAIHIGVILFLGFATLPRQRKHLESRPSLADLAIMAGVAVCTVYTVLSYDRIVMNPGNADTTDLVMAMFLLVIILEGSRRALGWIFPIMIGALLTYAVAGPLLPGLWAHKGFSLKIILETLYMTTNGIWGQITSISATIVATFTIFGAILLRTGGGETFLDFAGWATQKATGGAPKMTVLSSGLFGMINGNGPANVAATGTFTIPMMKKLGYKGEFAAAVEATASSGGQIMPPIMGAGAFVMAELLGMPYAKIALAGVIPALLYYWGATVSIHSIVMRDYGRDAQAGVVRRFRDIIGLERLMQLIVPLGTLIVLLTGSYTATYAAFWACIAGMVTYLVFSKSIQDTRDRCLHCLRALADGGIGLITVGILVASAQIVVTLISLTGLSVKLSQVLFELAHGNLGLSLVLTMFICLLLGMGVPTVAAYILCATVCAAPLVNSGLAPVSVHMFIFYFAVMSAVTPPVCASVYVACSIAESDWLKTGKMAVVLALSGFVVPFVFIYSPAILMEGNFEEIARSLITGLIGVTALSLSVTGYLIGRTNLVQRMLLFCAALGSLEPSLFGDVFGALVMGTVLCWQFFKTKSDARESRIFGSRLVGETEEQGVSAVVGEEGVERTGRTAES